MAKNTLGFALGGAVAIAVAVGCGEGATLGESVTSAAQASPSDRIASAGMPLTRPCTLLDDERIRARMSGALETHLLRSCGRASPATGRGSAERSAVAHEGEMSATNAAVSAGGVDVMVNDPSLDVEGTIQSETSVAVSGNVVCAAWNDTSELAFGRGSGFGFSHDGGKTFSDGGSLPDVSSNGDPSLAYSERDGAFYHVALSDGGLWLWRSNDGCQTFSSLGPVHFNFADDKEMMAIDNSPASPHFGRIYVGWTDFSRTGDHNVVSFSDDGGSAWSEPAVLPGSGQNGQGMWPAIAPNGDAYFALANLAFEIGGLQDQWIYKAVEGGQAGDAGAAPALSWVRLADIGSAQLRPENIDATFFCGRQALNGNIRNLSSPQIAIHADPTQPAGFVIHATYARDADGAGPDNSDVFYRRSVDGAQSWSSEIRLSDDATTTDQFLPALGVDAGGTVVSSWYDRRLDPDLNLAFDRFAAFSADGGKTWSSNVRLSDSSSPVGVNFEPVAPCYHGDYDQVAVREGIGHVVWSDDRRITATGPNPDVYYDALLTLTSVGRVVAESTAIRCDGTLRAQLLDKDLAGTGSASLEVSVSSGDLEALTLTENGNAPGTFSGSIESAAGPPVEQDGVLQVQGGDTIGLTYRDADTGGGEPGTAEAEVAVDCTAPTIAGVSVAGLGPDRATVSVAGTDIATVAIDYGRSCQALTGTATGSGSSAKLFGLESGATYFFRVTATDLVGNASTDDNSGACYTFTTLDLVFLEDFEHGLGGFTIDQGLWHLSAACASDLPDHSAPHTLYYGIDASCTFENGNSHAGSARSPVIELSDASAAVLEFNYFLGGEGGFYDRARVALSVSGGPFVALAESQLGTLLVNTGVWQHASFDLAPLLQGLPDAYVQIEFSFDTIDSAANQFPGFYVDDVSVVGVTEPVPCETDDDCVDDRFCNGTERCEAGFCARGERVVCSDGDEVDCTRARCDEATRGCISFIDDAFCDDGSFCNGAETCNPQFGCQIGSPPCEDSIGCTENLCDEFFDHCQAFPRDFLCSDGLICNGYERCDLQQGCVAGEAPSCDDGINCTIDTCDDSLGCQSSPVDVLCDDGLFCNGRERCDVNAGSCVAGTGPCAAGERCVETSDACAESCVTATNGQHTALGRAHLLLGVVYLAEGSNDLLGTSADEVTSLRGGNGAWRRVAACPTAPSVDALEALVVGNTVLVNGATSDPNSDVTQVELTFQIYGVPFTIPADGTSVFSAVVPNLPVGTHFVWARAFDATDLVSEPAPALAFTILLPASPQIDSIEASATSSGVVISGLASDPNDDIAQVTVTVRRGTEVVASERAFTFAPWSVTFADLEPGRYNARAQALDSTGRASTLSESVTFEVAEQATDCFTANNAQHRAAARARSVVGNTFYFALGSNDFLGVSGDAVTSLRGSGAYWELTPNCSP